MKSTHSLKRFNIRLDLVVVLCMILVSIPVVLYFNVRFLTSTFFFFVVPSIYLFIRSPKNPKRLLATLLLGTIASFNLDFLAEFNNAWNWAPYGQLVFKSKILGYVTPDVMIWFAFWVFLTIVFYEHFFEHDRSDKISPRFKFALGGTIIATVIIVLFYFFCPSVLQFRYAYLIIGLMFGLPPLVFLFIKRPSLLAKFAKASAFPFVVFLSFEITALKLDQWRFPGEYIGWVSLLGVSFPLEEFFFWIVMSTVISLTYYEFLVDDEK